MAPSTFGVTAATVRAAYFGHLDEFSASSVPSAVQVADFVTKSAAILDGKLLQESVTASEITDTASSAYVWCADTIQLATAIRCIHAMQSSDPDIAKAWLKELTDRYEDLGEKGYLALGGGATAPAQQADGPSHHLDEYSLTVDSADDMSDAVPVFRRSDLL